MTESTNIFVTVLVGAYLVYSIFKVILHHKLNKQAKEYEAMVAEKMNQMQVDIESRAADLKESMQMINQEYQQIMKTLQKQQFNDAKHLRDAMAKFEGGVPNETGQDAPEPSTSDDKTN
ncbi:MAG: hypothetical protein ACON35_04240 [Candidatus Marinamargulisbacteria bacterium]